MLSTATSVALTLGFLGLPGHLEFVIIGLIALLLFGRRLPEVARSMGSAIVEFKRGVKGITEDIDSESSKGAASKAESSRELPEESSTEERRTVARGEAEATPHPGA